MEQILNTIGIDTELLKSKPIHTRDGVMKILRISHITLRDYEKKNLIQASRFRRKKYYTSKSIMNCIRIHFGLELKEQIQKIVKANSIKKINTVISLLDKHILNELRNKELNEDKIQSLTGIRTEFSEELKSLIRVKNIKTMFDKDYFDSYRKSKW